MKTINNERRLCLLDRNAVDCIKKANAGEEPPDEKTKILLERLRSLDRRNLLVSPILSIIEGEKGRVSTTEETAACLVKEATEVKRFFKNAGVDSNYLLNNVALGSANLTGDIEEMWEWRERFLLLALPLLGSGVPKSKRAAIETQIITAAQKTGLQAGDPALMLALAALYGGLAATKLLKPTTMQVYNVLSDLHVVSRIGFLIALARNSNIMLSVEVVTKDAGLDGVLKGIELVDQNLSADGSIQHEVRYSETLFNQLSRDEVLDLMDRVSAAYVSPTSGEPPLA